jgi:hypothetical protein
MADTKLSDLIATTSAVGDLLYTVDVSDTADSAAGSSRKITAQNLFDLLVTLANSFTAGQTITLSGDGALTINSSGGSNTPTGLILKNTDSPSGQTRVELGTAGDSGTRPSRGLVLFATPTVTGLGDYEARAIGIYTGTSHGSNSIALGISTDGTVTVYTTALDLSSVAWIRNNPGRKRLSANATNATATLSSGVLSDLTVTLVAGKKYTGRIVLIAKNSTAGEGLQFDFNGGTATMTNFQATVEATPVGATIGVGNTTALATALTNTTVATTDTIYAINLTMVVNAGGTFIPRFAENSAHVSGTATVELGSHLRLDDT